MRENPAQQTAQVDVLIPAFNAEKTLIAALRSIQDQTVADIRLLVVNDGSTDGTGEVLRAIAAADPRVQVIDTPNRGIVAALNLALAHATAPVVARHDADDLAFPDRFARQLDYLARYPDCIAVSGDAFHIDATGRRTGWVTTFAGDVKPDADAIPAYEPYLMHPFLMMPRAALVAAGGYRYVLHAEDTDLYWRLLGTGRLHTLSGPVGEYRVHAGSISGGAIHNGRVAAVYAELAALSYRRRRDGQEDLVFSEAALADTRALRSVDQILAYVGGALTGPERDRLRVSVAAKLFYNATFRDHLLEAEDAAFIAASMPTLRSRSGFTAGAHLSRFRAVVLWRLMRAGRMDAFRALRPGVRDYLGCARIAALQLAKRLHRPRAATADGRDD